ncbi:cytochrome P450 [Penicillium longicatenatum]|uniref:cytochrome P450 n=1 Tax=Penicillium longicatenatum TaxID=1561947 RepID=UPI002546C6E4|nr:cytochrome P450 [Penicillium longicatenatum]KAJ5661213.1 cytochrome P450 [Penicillium longicatenatum]
MAFLTLAAVLAAVAYLTSTYFTSKRAPAGLRNVPVAGKYKDLSKYPQREWRKWAQQHGELFQIRLGWENWVFVNSPEAMKEIFNKQSQHTSSRAPSPILSDLISGGMRCVIELDNLVDAIYTEMAETTGNRSPTSNAQVIQYIYAIAGV